MKKFFCCFLLGIVLVVICSGCASNTNSDVVKQDGITFKKITRYEDGIGKDAYLVTGCYEEITILNIPSHINDLPVVGINDSAFANNTTIKEIVIPSTVSRPAINLEAPFAGCTNVEKITVPFSDFSGLFYTGGSSSINEKERLPDTLRYLYLTDDCTEIDTRDFYFCSSLREIHIPYSVKNIEDGTNYIKIGVNGHSPSSSSKFQDLPFLGCNRNLRVFCEVSSKPEGWDAYWNYIDSTTELEVIWGEY